MAILTTAQKLKGSMYVASVLIGLAVLVFGVPIYSFAAAPKFALKEQADSSSTAVVSEGGMAPAPAPAPAPASASAPAQAPASASASAGTPESFNQASAIQAASLDHLASISSFYQMVIAFLTVLIGVVSVIAFFTIRHLSKLAAEEMALDAAKRVIDDSRGFQERIDDLVQESIASANGRTEALEREVALLAEKVSSLDVQEGEMTVIRTPTPTPNVPAPAIQQEPARNDPPEGG